MKTNEPLTRCQGAMYREIKDFIRDREYSPSVRELCRLTDLSPSTVHHHLVSLEAKGRIRRNGCAHGIEVL